MQRPDSAEQRGQVRELSAQDCILMAGRELDTACRALARETPA